MRTSKLVAIQIKKTLDKSDCLECETCKKEIELIQSQIVLRDAEIAKEIERALKSSQSEAELGMLADFLLHGEE